MAGEGGEQGVEQPESAPELPSVESVEEAAAEPWLADIPEAAEAPPAAPEVLPPEPAPEPAADAPAELPELSPELKNAQALHAWDRHGADEFSQIGIEDADGLKTHIEEVRNTAERAFETRPGVGCYGRSDAGDGGTGTIVIDNPSDLQNGGTAFRNDNVARRTDQLGYIAESDP